MIGSTINLLYQDSATEYKLKECENGGTVERKAQRMRKEGEVIEKNPNKHNIPRIYHGKKVSLDFR